MSIQGLRDTSNFVADQRPKNWREGIMLLWPNGKAPLTALTTMMKSESTDDPEFNWWEKTKADQRLESDASWLIGATTISVASGALTLKDGHLLWVAGTDEIMLVNGDPSADTSITVVRAYAGTTAAAYDPTAIGANPYLWVVGSAYEEGSDAPTGINYDPTKKFNYTQIFRNTLEMTRTASKSRLRTGDAVKEAKRECLELHSTEIEKAFIFGGRNETTRNGKPIRTTGGIISFIAAANVVNQAGAAADLMDLEGWMEQIFRYGSSEKMAFVGNIALLTIQRIVRKNSTYDFVQGQKEFGMNVSRLISPFGEIVLKSHPLFNEYTGGTTGGTAYYGVNSWMMVLDMANFKYRYFSGDDTRYEKNLQNNGLDSMKSGYLTEAGLEVHHPNTHFLIKGLATAAADA